MQVSFTQGKTHMFVKLIGVYEIITVSWERGYHSKEGCEQNGSNCWCLTTKYKHFKNLDISRHFCMRIIVMLSEKKHFFIERSLFNFKYVYKDLDIRFLVWKVINKYKIFL